jgi:hypothetical protein
MIITEVQLQYILSTDKNNPDAALRYMQEHNISPNAELDSHIPGMRIPLVFALIDTHHFELTKHLINTTPELTQEQTEIPAMPPLSSFPSSVSLLSTLFSKRPLNQDMLFFLLSKGCAATDLNSGLWGQIEIWQLLALSGDLEGLSLLLEATPNLDVTHKIRDFTIFDIFEHNSEEVVTWFNHLKHTIKANIDAMLPVVLQMSSTISPLLPTTISAPTLNVDMTVNEVCTQISAFISEYRRYIEENTSGNIPESQANFFNFLMQQMTEMGYLLKVFVNQEKIMNQERTPALQSCFDLLQSRREAIEAKNHTSIGRSSLFWIAAKASSTLLESEEHREILETYPEAIVAAVTSAQKYANT